MFQSCQDNCSHSLKAKNRRRRIVEIITKWHGEEAKVVVGGQREIKAAITDAINKTVKLLCMSSPKPAFLNRRDLSRYRDLFLKIQYFLISPWKRPKMLSLIS